MPKDTRLGKNASELALFSRLIRIFDLVLDTPLGNVQINLPLPSLIRIFNVVGENLLTTNELEEIHM